MSRGPLPGPRPSTRYFVADRQSGRSATNICGYLPVTISRRLHLAGQTLRLSIRTLSVRALNQRAPNIGQQRSLRGLNSRSNDAQNTVGGIPKLRMRVRFPSSAPQRAPGHRREGHQPGNRTPSQWPRGRLTCRSRLLPTDRLIRQASCLDPRGMGSPTRRNVSLHHSACRSTQADAAPRPSRCATGAFE
jgi:hypothetical protein